MTMLVLYVEVRIDYRFVVKLFKCIIDSIVFLNKDRIRLKYFEVHGYNV